MKKQPGFSRATMRPQVRPPLQLKNRSPHSNSERISAVGLEQFHEWFRERARLQSCRKEQET
jgi:hypothetical protein